MQVFGLWRALICTSIAVQTSHFEMFRIILVVSVVVEQIYLVKTLMLYIMCIEGTAQEGMSRI